ncbi:MAG: hypothetical protein A3H35_00760 [Betaproteobacteria bacterium RIFCSPLOWO2_02_FULL_62_17]|nr:MAG: hypothetical protein A3H35_00760 [Betaproteobacteria bacterium RIFCSPLOWO2_02_FULL_62_17]
MGKWLFLVLLALVVYLAVKAARRKVRAKVRSLRTPEDMVACGRCGVNLPKSEAFQSQGRYFCCKDHGDSETA